MGYVGIFVWVYPKSIRLIALALRKAAIRLFHQCPVAPVTSDASLPVTLLGGWDFERLIISLRKQKISAPSGGSRTNDEQPFVGPLGPFGPLGPLAVAPTPPTFARLLCHIKLCPISILPMPSDGVHNQHLGCRRDSTRW